MSESSHYFIFLSNFLEKSMILPSNLQSILLEHLSKLESKFTENFAGTLSIHKWIHDPFAQPAPSSFTPEEKKDYVDLICYNS